MLAAGCAAQATHDPAAGAITGMFIREGGPLGPGGTQPKVVRLHGRVDFTSARGHVVHVRVGKSGRFTVTLPPGTYQVSGRSPQIAEVDNSGHNHVLPCSQPVSVTVTSQHTSKVTVRCDVP
jgi:hypothetical protein